jgi:hypothetical protein
MKTPKDGTIDLWNPASWRSVWLRGDQLFREHSSGRNNFFPDIDNLFSDIGTLNTNFAAGAASYLIMSFLFEMLLEFLVLTIGVDVISYVDVICLSTFLLHMFSLFPAFVIMQNLQLIRIRSYDNLLFY